ncbi:histone H1-like [Spinachia spinachia]
MAEVAPAAAAAAAPKAAKKKVSKPKKVGPSVSDLIVKTVAASKERSGVSAAAVKKALTAGGYDVDKNKARVKTAIKSLVAKGTLVQIKGIGASGSFKMSKTTADKPATKAAPRAKKPAAAKKPKAAAVKKVVDLLHWRRDHRSGRRAAQHPGCASAQEDREARQVQVKLEATVYNTKALLRANHFREKSCDPRVPYPMSSRVSTHIHVVHLMTSCVQYGGHVQVRLAKPYELHVSRAQ